MARPVYDPSNYNTLMLLQNEEQGQLEKVANFYDVSNVLTQEVKTFPLALVGSAALSRTFNYDVSGNLIGETVALTPWTQTMEDNAIPPLIDILLSNNLSTPGLPDGTKIGDLTAVGGLPPIIFTLQSDPGNDFRIDNGNELVWNGTSSSGSFPITIRAVDNDAQTLDVMFTIESAAFVNATSVLFNGSDENIDLGTTADIQFDKTNSFSFSCWFYRNTGSGTDYIYSTNTGGNNGQGIGIGTDGNERVNFRLNGGTAGNRINVRTPISSYTIATWHHLVCTYDGTELASGCHIYIDGVDQVLTNVQDALSGDFAVTNDSKIGSRSDDASYSSSNIDEFSIHNIELSSAQVTSIYNSGTPMDLTAFAGIIHWYRMGDNDTFGFVTDNVGSLDGAMINMAPSNFDTANFP